jgi:hypothetical protein
VCGWREFEQSERFLTGLADHLELANRRVLPHPLREKRLAARVRIVGDIVQRVADIVKIDAIVLHREAASARIRSCRCGLRPPP